MYGKTSVKKNKKYDEFYGVEKSSIIKNKISLKNKGKLGLLGEKNGMYGKTPINKGKTPNDLIKKKIKDGVVRYWNSLSDAELNKRKNKLREEWLIKRNRYSEIDTIPEKNLEKILIDLKIPFLKKINVGYYNCDFIINDLIIEVQGDYWHANPLIYEKHDKIQNKNVKRDIRKYKFLVSSGYRVIYLWEYDLKNNINSCKEFISNILLK